MKNNASFKILHRLFGAGSILIIGGFLVFLASLYFMFGGLLTGDVRVNVTPDLLTSLQPQRFDAAVSRMNIRMNTPSVSAELPDPFDAPSK